MKPNFSICFIGRNEGAVFQRALDSLKEFKERGGEICYLDTGSKDNTVQIAKDFGCIVGEAGEEFLSTITKEQVDAVNDKFLVEGEECILDEGGKLFDFASARNACADRLATNDMVAWLDCDEAYTKLDIDTICKHIDEGVDQFEYEFVFSHDHLNKPLLQFVQSKFYNKKKMKWVGIVHEVIDGPGKRQYLPETVIKNEHWQNQETNRHGYLRGLAIDCFMNPGKDRNSHYFARELMWHGRHKSAIKEFERYLTISWWKPERSESMVYIGDCYRRLGDKIKAVEYYHKAFQEESSRREPLIKLAELYNADKDIQRVICYCKAALEISWNSFYSNNKFHYGYIPHEMLAEAYWCAGDKVQAREQLEKALSFEQTHGKLLYDLRFHYDLPKISIIIPTLGRPEGLERCLASISGLNYPSNLIETIVLEDEPRIGVPKRLKEGLEKSTGEYIVYGSNDCSFAPESIILAWREMKNQNALLLAFNTGDILPDEGNICEHFMIRRDYAVAKDGLDGEIFDTEFNHLGVDNLLWAKVCKLNRAVRSNNAIINHYHFTKGAEFDSTYSLGWNDESAKKDRELLKTKLKNLK
jgi:glycosyltransferase involved in cell wall biosynthesis